MKMSKMLGERTKTIPSEATEKGYANLLRAGYIKQVASGIFSLLPPAKLVVNNIENIIREEMNKVDGQEVLFPVVMPKEMWEESGRYYSIGEEMARFKDRSGRDMLLGMTHEEAAVHMAKNTVSTYNQMPFMIYQIQTKFRDEPRSRGGLIRVREFTMKDAYSFHNNQEELNAYYNRVHQSYMNIFKRIGLKKYISVASDTGMMGGSGAHEFMFLNEIGEDTLVICDKCGYKANMEVAICKGETKTTQVEELKEIFTGEAKSIEEVCKLLNIQPYNTCKAVCYGNKSDEKQLIIAFTRGDLEINEAKLKKVVKCDIYPANLNDFETIKSGNIGPIALPQGVTVVFDQSLQHEASLVCGSNKEQYHMSGFNFARDLKDAQFYDISKVNAGSKCAICGEELTISKGVEIGNIFKLGTKYTASMNMQVHDNNGRLFNPIMGCYGIGVGRALACVAQESSDEKGLCWPVSIAPWHIYLCPLKYGDETVKKATDKIYEELTNAGIKVILDDRNVSAGYKFADSELIGVPFRVVVSARTLENNSVEFVTRENGEKQDILINQLTNHIQNLIK